jgi:uncharacterized protein (DUF1919 family)
MIKTIIKKALSKTNRVIVQPFSRKARFGRSNKDISIISNNCIAGFLYRDLHIPYNSPTVGLQFTQEGFVDFCRNYSDYIQLPITRHPNLPENEFRALGGETINFPVGKLGDLTLFLQHYKTVEEAATAWERRRERLNRSKLFFIFMAYDNTETSVINDFESLPLDYSLTLSHMYRNDSTLSVPLMCGKAPWYSIDPISGKPFYWKFDYINWIRECLVKQSAEQGAAPDSNSAALHCRR